MNKHIHHDTCNPLNSSHTWSISKTGCDMAVSPETPGRNQPLSKVLQNQRHNQNWPQTWAQPSWSEPGFHIDHLDSLCHPHASCWILSKFAGLDHPLLPLTRMTGHSNKTHLSPRWCHVKDGKWLNNKQLPYGKSISVYSLPLSHRVSFFHGKF